LCRDRRVRHVTTRHNITSPSQSHDRQRWSEREGGMSNYLAASLILHPSSTALMAAFRDLELQLPLHFNCYFLARECPCRLLTTGEGPKSPRVGDGVGKTRGRRVGPHRPRLSSGAGRMSMQPCTSSPAGEPGLPSNCMVGLI
jgi:hypothetical protein